MRYEHRPKLPSGLPSQTFGYLPWKRILANDAAPKVFREVGIALSKATSSSLHDKGCPNRFIFCLRDHLQRLLSSEHPLISQCIPKVPVIKNVFRRLSLAVSQFPPGVLKGEDMLRGTLPNCTNKLIGSSNLWKVDIEERSAKSNVVGPSDLFIRKDLNDKDFEKYLPIYRINYEYELEVEQSIHAGKMIERLRCQRGIDIEACNIAVFSWDNGKNVPASTNLVV